MKIAQINEPNSPLVIQELDTPQPVGDQVLIKVNATGVCHSDLHLWEGGYDLGDGTFMRVTDRGVKYPITPGHEIVGTVYAIGEKKEGKDQTSNDDIEIGDSVLVYPWIGCNQCVACKTGNENLCDTPKSLGVFQNGGYAQYVLVPHSKYLAKVNGVDLDGVASLACSGLTAYTAIKKANVNSPEFLVIIGAGGLGLMGVQIASAITSAKIICVDLDDEKLTTAKDMGADFIVNSKDPKTSEKILSICNQKGADSVVDFVNAPPTAKLGLSILRKRGNLVLVGLFGGSIDLSLVTVPLKAITIQGAYTGNYNDMIELLDLAKKGAVNPIVSKHYSLDNANNALNDLKDRKIIGRAVINPW